MSEENANANDNSNKVHLSIAICGTVDAGKSTTVGHLLYKLGSLDERQKKKLQEEADAHGKSSFAFAFFMDRQKEERERGITIQTTTEKFYTDTKYYTIADNPGHKDYLKNMIKGSCVDAAMLLIPANGGFIASIAKENRKKNIMQGQSRQHALILSMLGVKQLIVGINKMDSKIANFSQERYEEIKAEVVRMLKRVGWKKQVDAGEIPIIPYSGWTGDNLIEPTDKMPWWQGVDVNVGSDTVHVHTILDALDKMIVVPPKNLEAPFRVPIGGVYNIRGVGDVLTGRLEQGTLEPGTEVVFLPNHTSTNPCVGKVFTIEMHHENVDQAEEGDNIGMNIKGLPKGHGVSRGAVMVRKGDETINICKTFTAQVKVLSHPGELTVGYTPVAMVRTNMVSVRIAKINWKLSGKTKIPNPHSIKSGEAAELVFEPAKPLVVERFKDCQGMGRAAILEGNSVIMICKVVDVEY